MSGPVPGEPIAPAVLAEDLRALAECVPFEPRTMEILEQAADVLEGLPGATDTGNAPDVAALDRLRDAFEAAGATERAWGAHYAAMVMRGQLPVEQAATGPGASVITGRYRTQSTTATEPGSDAVLDQLRHDIDNQPSDKPQEGTCDTTPQQTP